jgi:hypothetical protein
MIVHLVLVKLKPGFTREHPQVVAWQALVAALPSKVSGLVRWETGWNVSERPIAYDFGVNSAFSTREDLAAYGPHPAHQQVVAAQREIADWVICDYELGEWVSD